MALSLGLGFNLAGNLRMANMVRYRVWPDGTVQEVSETPYSWMSDDYETVDAVDEEDAYAKVCEQKIRPGTADPA